MTISAHQHAVAFLKKFPIGSIISHDQFDEWAVGRGLLKEPRSTVPDSDAWLAHLQRRHQVRYHINNAGINKRMLDVEGATTFTLDRIGSDQYEVRTAHIALISNNTARKVQTLTRTKRRQLAKFMGGIDWPLLPPFMKLFVESLYDDTAAFRDTVELELRKLTSKYLKLATRLQALIDDGTLPPNPEGRLVQLLLPFDETVEDENDNGES